MPEAPRSIRKSLTTRRGFVAFSAIGLATLTPAAYIAVRGLLPEPNDAGEDTAAGWMKYKSNPVLGGSLGTCFDVGVLREDRVYRMWFSWRPRRSIALVESEDGIHWSEPVIVLGPNPATGWEESVNRPGVMRLADSYYLWYTGQARGQSWIGCATSADGRSFRRKSGRPVLEANVPWEKGAVMCPHVLYDQSNRVFRMWYSGGEQYEPNAIGYATSPDGLVWTKDPGNPIFVPDWKNAWEKDRVTACQVIAHGGWHLMFYIGFSSLSHAQIGAARSRDGVRDWERHAANPLIRPSNNGWDKDAVYKPYAVLDGNRWLMWYNGRRGKVETIGLAIHDGADLGF